MKRPFVLFAALCALFLLPGCKNTGNKSALPKADDAAIRAQLDSMTLREKVGQLFCVRPESLDPVFQRSSEGMMAYRMQAVNEETAAFAAQYPVGGVTLFSHNIDNPGQLKAFTQAIHALPGAPLVSVDEEGGRVARVGGNLNFDVPRIPAMGKVGATGDPAKAYEAGKAIGHYLKEYGFDIDFAPVADVNTNPDNIIIGPRAFSDDPQVAAPMVTNYLQGLKDAGIIGCIKHFPGHGDTKTDTHFGYASTQKTWEEMMDCEMVTFKAGIKWGCQLIMTAHIGAPNVTGSDIPSTMSSVILQDKLRGELGYQNIIITDGMEMGAITQQYSSAEAAVKSIQAGVDIVLGPKNLVEAFDAVIDAVNKGTISEERINQSVRRILKIRQ